MEWLLLSACELCLFRVNEGYWTVYKDLTKGGIVVLCSGMIVQIVRCMIPGLAS